MHEIGAFSSLSTYVHTHWQKMLTGTSRLHMSLGCLPFSSRVRSASLLPSNYPLFSGRLVPNPPQTRLNRHCALSDPPSLSLNGGPLLVNPCCWVLFSGSVCGVVVAGCPDPYDQQQRTRGEGGEMPKEEEEGIAQTNSTWTGKDIHTERA